MTKKHKIKSPMRIDLHLHTKERSACSKASEEEMINAAIRAGLNAIVITDHTKLVSKIRLTQLNKKHAPFRIFGGIEIAIKNEHLLVLGIQDKKLETTEWTYPELHTFCRKKNGFIALAHPYRFSNEIDLDLENYPLDALELYSANTPIEQRDHIIELASKLNIPKLSNSDAHLTIFIGKYYNILDSTPTNEKELIKILRQGKFTRAVIEKIDH